MLAQEKAWSKNNGCRVATRSARRGGPGGRAPAFGNHDALESLRRQRERQIVRAADIEARVRRQVWLVIGTVLAAYAVLRMSLGALAQDPSYHLLADTRVFLGIPRAGDVLTNLAILAAGLFGLAFRPRMQVGPEERSALNVLIAATLLTFFGSAYYHWAPANATLVWDRLPLAIILVSVLVLVMADRLHPLFARLGIWPLTALAVAGVAFWGISEAMGSGDLLLYLIVRVGAGVAIALLLILRRPLHTGTKWMILALLCELAMAALERFDHQIFQLTGGGVSGHSLKHIMVGVALGFVFWWLRVRKPLTPGTA
jgi:hypothetical protein